MKVYLGNNLGYRLQLISANQKKRHSRLAGHQFQTAKMPPVFSHYPFFIMGFKDKFGATLAPALPAIHPPDSVSLKKTPETRP